MIKLTDILNEVRENLIGPFYHETNKESVEGILKHGLKPEQQGSSYAINSLSPAKPSEMYGDVVLKVWLNPRQFKQAMKHTYDQMAADLHFFDPREVQLLELLIKGNIGKEEYQELVKRATTDSGFLAGEVVYRDVIGPDQIKLAGPINEAKEKHPAGVFEEFAETRGKGRPKKNQVESVAFDPKSVQIFKGSELNFNENVFRPMSTGTLMDTILSSLAFYLS